MRRPRSTPVRAPVSRRTRWRRSLLLRALSAGCVGLATWLVVAALLPDPPETGDQVVVMARAVPIGAALTEADVRLERRPTAEVPDGAVRLVADSVGRLTSGPLLRGEMVTTARLRGAAQLGALPAGRLAVSVPVLDAGLLASVRPADEVAILVPGSGQTVTEGATVLSVGGATGVGGVAGSDGSGSGPFGSGSVSGSAGSAATSVVVALTTQEASSVAAALGQADGVTGFLLALKP